MNSPLKDIIPVKEQIINAQLVKERHLIHYRLLEIDLTKVRNNEEIDLERRVINYSEIKCLYAPSTFYIRLNDKQNDALPFLANSLTNFFNLSFDKLFITNDAGNGTALLYIASRED